MKRALIRGIIVVFLACGLLYLADYVLLRYRIATNGHPLATVQVERYYAVPQKNGKTQFLFDQPETDTCVESLFPHLGDSPCWYLRRHKEKRVNL